MFHKAHPRGGAYSSSAARIQSPVRAANATALLGAGLVIMNKEIVLGQGSHEITKHVCSRYIHS